MTPHKLVTKLAYFSIGSDSDHYCLSKHVMLDGFNSEELLDFGLLSAVPINAKELQL